MFLLFEKRLYLFLKWDINLNWWELSVVKNVINVIDFECLVIECECVKNIKLWLYFWLSYRYDSFFMIKELLVLDLIWILILSIVVVSDEGG